VFACNKNKALELQRVPILSILGYNIGSLALQFPKPKTKGRQIWPPPERPQVLLRHCYDALYLLIHAVTESVVCDREMARMCRCDRAADKNDPAMAVIRTEYQKLGRMRWIVREVKIFAKLKQTKVITILLPVLIMMVCSIVLVAVGHFRWMQPESYSCTFRNNHL